MGDKQSSTEKLSVRSSISLGSPKRSSYREHMGTDCKAVPGRPKRSKMNDLIVSKTSIRYPGEKCLTNTFNCNSHQHFMFKSPPLKKTLRAVSLKNLSVFFNAEFIAKMVVGSALT